MKSYAISLTVILILLLSGINFINTAKEQWIKTLAANNEHLIDFCSIDPSLLGCDDPDYK